MKTITGTKLILSAMVLGCVLIGHRPKDCSCDQAKDGIELFAEGKVGEVKTIKTKLPFHSAAQEIEINVVDNHAILEGDIVLSENVRTDNFLNPKTGSNDADLPDMMHKAVAIDGLRYRWENGVIPYEISSSFDSYRANEIRRAISHINSKTNIQLVPKNSSHRNAVFFFPGSGCWSYVGKSGGQQKISIGQGCGFGAIVHEVCHAAGLFHEQSRADRDDYITINWDNIIPQYKYAFHKHVTDATDIGSYDYNSIMHYPSTAFSKNGRATIVGKRSSNFGQRNGLSQGDINALNALYPRTGSNNNGGVVTNGNNSTGNQGNQGNTTSTSGGYSYNPRITAAVNRWDKRVYFFTSNNRYFRFNGYSGAVDLGYPKGTREAWCGPNWNDIDAAVSWDNDKIYLFKGDYYARYDLHGTGCADAGYPKLIRTHWPGMPWSSVDAAVNWKNERVYFFKGAEYVRYNLKTNRVDAGYPKPIKQFWPGMPWTHIDAAVNWDQQKIYFFKGNEYVRYDMATSRVDAGYPKPIRENWTGL